jgi:hypothetical protein
MILDPPHEFEKLNAFGLSDLDVPIYRIFPKRWLLESIKTGRLALRKPSAWEDPFENFLLKQRVRFGGKDVHIAHWHDNFYGQCWTLRPENDAMWRIYSPEKNSPNPPFDGMKVKTTAKKLFHALWSTPHQFAALRYFIGKVEYWDEKQITNYFTDPQTFKQIIFDGTARGPAMALMIKRPEFSHEEEVRLLLQCSEKEPHPDTQLIQFDVNTVFDEIVLDPRITDSATVNDWTNELTGAGFRNVVRQSPLYKLPTPTVIDLD